MPSQSIIITRTIYDPAVKNFVFDSIEERAMPIIRQWIEKKNPFIYWYILRIDNPSEHLVLQWAVELYTHRALSITEAYIEGIDRRFELRKSELDHWNDKYIISIPKELGIPIVGSGIRRIIFKVDVNCHEALMHKYGISGRFIVDGIEPTDIRKKLFIYSCKVGEFRQIFNENPDEASSLAKKSLLSRYSPDSIQVFTNSFRIIYDLTKYCNSSTIEKDELFHKLNLLHSNFEKVPEISSERITPLLDDGIKKLFVIDTANMSDFKSRYILLCESLLELLHLEVICSNEPYKGMSQEKEEHERFRKQQEKEVRFKKSYVEERKKKEEEIEDIEKTIWISPGRKKEILEEIRSGVEDPKELRRLRVEVSKLREEKERKKREEQEKKKKEEEERKKREEAKQKEEAEKVEAKKKQREIEVVKKIEEIEKTIWVSPGTKKEILEEIRSGVEDPKELRRLRVEVAKVREEQERRKREEQERKKREEQERKKREEQEKKKKEEQERLQKQKEAEANLKKEMEELRLRREEERKKKEKEEKKQREIEVIKKIEEIEKTIWVSPGRKKEILEEIRSGVEDPKELRRLRLEVAKVREEQERKKREEQERKKREKILTQREKEERKKIEEEVEKAEKYFWISPVLKSKILEETGKGNKELEELRKQRAEAEKKLMEEAELKKKEQEKKQPESLYKQSEEEFNKKEEEERQRKQKEAEAHLKQEMEELRRRREEEERKKKEKEEVERKKKNREELRKRNEERKKREKEALEIKQQEELQKQIEEERKKKEKETLEIEQQEELQKQIEEERKKKVVPRQFDKKIPMWFVGVSPLGTDVFYVMMLLVFSITSLDYIIGGFIICFDYYWYWNCSAIINRWNFVRHYSRKILYSPR